MSAERDVTVVLVDIKNIGVGQRVVLGLEAICLDGGEKIIDVGACRVKSKGAKRIAVQGAHLGADCHALAVLRGSNGRTELEICRNPLSQKPRIFNGVSASRRWQ